VADSLALAPRCPTGAAQELLDTEPQHYQGLVMKGKALAELGRTTDSEQAYRAAVAASPADPLAWMVRRPSWRSQRCPAT